MELAFFTMLLMTSVCSMSAKHVFVTYSLNWPNAQKYCRTNYTDLSPLSNEVEDQAFRRSFDQKATGWIGLYSTSPSTRKWSGGANATYLNFVKGHQNTFGKVLWTTEGWHSYKEDHYYHGFYCLNLIVVEEKKTWEEALEHCRDKHTEFTSLLSQTEVLLAQREIQNNNITDRVWVGLRYLEDRWLWVNQDPLEYVTWPNGGQDHHCPTWSHSCGALTKKGLWENRDCQEKLNFICY